MSRFSAASTRATPSSTTYGDRAHRINVNIVYGSQSLSFDRFDLKRRSSLQRFSKPDRSRYLWKDIYAHVKLRFSDAADMWHCIHNNGSQWHSVLIHSFDVSMRVHSCNSIFLLCPCARSLFRIPATFIGCHRKFFKLSELCA